MNYIRTFQSRNKIILPEDFKEYFKTLNGTNEKYTDELYEFYSIDKLKKVSAEFNDWKGVPNYQSLINLVHIKDLFVFSNFSFNLFVYAIKLCQQKTDNNEVYILCGSEYKKIGNSFSEFIDLYLSDSIELQFTKE